MDSRIENTEGCADEDASQGTWDELDLYSSNPYTTFDCISHSLQSPNPVQGTAESRNEISVLCPNVHATSTVTSGATGNGNVKARNVKNINTTQGPGQGTQTTKRSGRSTAEERLAILKSDPLIERGSIKPTSVKCKACKQTINLDKRGMYRLHDWTVHKQERCRKLRG